MPHIADLMEEAIDRGGLKNLLINVARICHEKADHIRANWQDQQLAAKWTRAGKAIYRLWIREDY